MKTKETHVESKDQPKPQPEPQPKQDFEKFSGIARTVECYNNQGFRNFRILTLTIAQGEVTAIERSDPYASFEAMAKMELANEFSILNLNNQWQNGKTLSK